MLEPLVDLYGFCQGVKEDYKNYRIFLLQIKHIREQ